MISINSSSLFHFTSKKEVLKKIITTGFRFSFCFESFEENNGMAVPMICFCDIPIMRSPKHRSKFGNYAIGLNKEVIMFKYNMNPVHYITSPTHDMLRSKYSKSIISSLEQSVSDGFKKAKEENHILPDEFEGEYDKKGLSVFGEDIHFELESLMFAKRFYKHQLAFTKVYSETLGGKKLNYYDENEWRMVPMYDSYDKTKLSWIEEISFKEFKERKSEFIETVNKAQNGYITIPAKDINKVVSFIIVKNENMVASLIKYILNSKTLFGSEGISDDERLLLISKITSFERIEKDY